MSKPIDDEKAIDTLILYLFNDPSPIVRVAIADNLGNISHFKTKIVTSLTLALSNENDENVKIKIIESICQLIEKSPENSMSESAKFNFYNSTIGNVANTVENDQIANQNINTNDTNDFDTLIKNLKSIIDQLKQNNSVNSPEEAKDIIEVEFTSAKESKSWQWKNLLELKRYMKGGKEAALEVGKHFTEDNVWGKGFIAFVEGFSEED